MARRGELAAQQLAAVLVVADQQLAPAAVQEGAAPVMAELAAEAPEAQEVSPAPVWVQVAVVVVAAQAVAPVATAALVASPDMNLAPASRYSELPWGGTGEPVAMLWVSLTAVAAVAAATAYGWVAATIG